MLDPKSDYALNKLTPDAIVYSCSDGTLTLLTTDDFSTVEEFLYWKAWSDENYHRTEKEEHIYMNHTQSLTNAISATVQSPEDTLLQIIEKQERQELCQLLITGLDCCLTSTQRRRFWMHYINRLTVRQIAEIEHVTHPSIVESLHASEGRLEKFLEKNFGNSLPKPCFRGVK